MESDVTQSAGYYKLLAWFEVNKARVIYGAAAAILIGIVVWFFVWRAEQKRIRAGEAFSEVFVPQATGMAAKSEAAPGYLKVASEFSNSKAGERALLLAATSLFGEGKFAEAQSAFERFTREHRGSPLMGQAQFGIAASLDAQGKTNDAVTAYKAIVDRRSAESVLPHARFALGRLYAAQGNHEAAFQIFDSLAMEERFTSLGSEAGMRAEELKAKHPELAPKPEAPAPGAGSPSFPVFMTNASPVQPTNPAPVPATTATTNK